MALFVTRSQYADLDALKELARIELEVWIGGAVLDVFDCNVLGAPHRYYCSEADQLRMINGKIANVSATLFCGLIPADPEADPIYEMKMHTSTEAGKVHTDYVTFSKNASETYSTVRNLINSATSAAELDTLFATYIPGWNY